MKPSLDSSGCLFVTSLPVISDEYRLITIFFSAVDPSLFCSVLNGLGETRALYSESLEKVMTAKN